MSALTLLYLAGLILLLPWYFLSPAARRPRAEAMPEIRGPLRALYWAMGAYCVVWHQLRVGGIAPLPESGPAILIANHTCGIDHVLLQVSCRRLLGFMIAREYYDSPWLHWICSYIDCIPVNRNGRELKAVRAAMKVLEAGRVLPIFPEGTIVPASGRQLGPMKPGTAYIAIRAGVPVVPAYIIGTPRTNEIMPSLFTPSRARVIYGPPIDLSDVPRGEAGDKALQAKVSQRFKDALLALQARAIAEYDRLE
jgi:1-acyl-sn-glycerol-3-phosphate acyltransferase